MISVVIPTMWKFEEFPNFLEILVQHPLINEIIIIDNDRSARPTRSVLNNVKVSLHDYGRNIFVNPAWNEGVRVAKNNKIAIVNDDIIFDTRVFDAVYNVLDTVGCIGLNVTSPTPTGLIKIVPLAGQPTFGFGMLVFVTKYTYENIPDGLNIYYGDNFIFDNCLWRGLPILLIENLFFYTPYATTTRTILDGAIRKSEEGLVYAEVITQHGRDPKIWCPHDSNVNQIII